MRVFISWSGERSKEVALALRWWLPLMFETVQPWMSSADIDKGSQWAARIARELEDADIGIVCVTPENLESPWLLFESGAIAKRFSNALVCTCLFGLTKQSVRGPLAQFQHTEFERNDIHQFVHSVNRANGRGARPDPDVDQLFEILWPLLEDRVATIPRGAPTSESHLEELAYLRQRAAPVAVTLLPESGDLFFNGKYVGNGPSTIRVNPEAQRSTISASSIDHLEWHHVLGQEDIDKGNIKIILERRTSIENQARRVSHWLRLRRQFPEDPVIARAIAIYLFSVGETDEAAEEAAFLVDVAPEWYGSYVTLGYVLADKDPDRAMRHFDMAVAKNPHHFIGYYNRACQHSLTGDYKECIRNLEQILENRQAVFMMTDVYDSVDDPDFDPIKNSKRYASRFEEVTSELLSRGRQLAVEGKTPDEDPS